MRYCFAVSISDIRVYAIAARTIKKFLTAVFVLSIAAIFVSLGFWQLGRAQDLHGSISSQPKVDNKIYQLPELLSPTASVDGYSIGKKVTARGYYIADFKAPNQIGADGKRADWQVSLFQVDPHSAILVVRGLWSQATSSKEPQIVMSNSVTITGTLQPHQTNDVAENTAQQLSRIDPSILTSMIDTQLYDGYIIADSETGRGMSVERTRLAAPASDFAKKVPGYYWQHISYVGIWWIMAALVLWMPFYKGADKLGI